MIEESPLLPSSEEESTQKSDVISLVIMLLTFVWIVVVAPLAYIIAWGAHQIMIATGGDWPVWGWAVISLAQVALLGGPLFWLASSWFNARYRAVFATWGVGAAFMLVMLPIRLLPPFAALGAVMMQVILTPLFLVLLQRLLHNRGKSVRLNGYIMPALLLAPFMVAPWLAFGALAALIGVILNLLAAWFFGRAVATIVGGYLLEPLEESSTGTGSDMALGGFAIGGLLLIMGVGFGFQGMALLFLSWPAIGWVAMGLTRWGEEKNLSALALFITLVAAAPMITIDPAELNLLLNLGTRDVLTWAFYAAAITIVLAWLLGIGMFSLRERLPTFMPSSALTGGAAVGWMAAIGIYFVVGQPGFYGDHLFVILKDQADVSAAVEIADREQRLSFVYETLTSHAEETQADLRGSLDSFGISYQPYYLVNAIDVPGNPLIRMWLSSRPEVERILDNPTLRPLPAKPLITEGSAPTPSSPHWNLLLIGADRVWEEFGVTGEGIIVGQSDSGVQGDHPELADSYRGATEGDDFNWFDPWYHTAVPTDIGGHGTHTLGSVLGNHVGVAPDAKWFGCVNLARNLANPALYLDCMQFMLAPFPQNGDPLTDGRPDEAAHVLNNSWGCPPEEGCDATSLQPAVQALRAAGIFVVASAGNEGQAGCETVMAPIALYDEVFTVGAVNEDAELADFSSRGPVTADGSGRTKPDIVAPGDNVLSSFPNNTYEYAGGTSMAGPHVVGVVALMWSANPSLIGDIERTEEILIETTKSASTGEIIICGDAEAVPNNAVGYGLVDAYAAVERALAEK